MATIWIDLDNAPHVLLFEPLIAELQARRHETIVTARDYGYTFEMLDRKGIPYDSVGRHPGKNIVRKVLGLASRVSALVRWARGRQIDVAVSHGSRGLVLASALQGIPCVTMYDYEFVATRVYRFSSKILLPEVLSDDATSNLGVARRRVIRYPGLKEEVYLGSFAPDPSITDTLDIPNNKVVVVVRPPATEAHYHSEVSESMFEAVLERLCTSDNVVGVIVPRTQVQARSIAGSVRDSDNIRLLTHPVNGPNLIWHADLVVGAGGTMNREAALLGVPVYSAFMSRPGEIDLAFAKQGKMTFLQDRDAVADMRFEKRPKGNYAEEAAARQRRSRKVIDFVCDEILSTVKS
jgi:predicted glycosyltransferase